MELEKQKRPRLKWWQEFLIILTLGLLVSVFIRIFVIEVHTVNSTSMLHTLEENDTVFTTGPIVNFFTDSDVLSHGDIIVFNDDKGWLDNTPYEGSTLIKRVIGIPGDTIVGSKSGDIYLNGNEITERYITQSIVDGDIPLPSSENIFETKLGRDEYWVMGDNRNYSLDSRTYGPIDSFSIKGKVIYVLNAFQ